MSDLLKRRGIIEIDNDLIKSNPEGVTEVLKDVLIVGVRNDFMQDRLTCSCYSKYFDLLKAGETMPLYVAASSRSSNNNLKVTWHREKEYTEESVENMLREIKETMQKNLNIN